MWEVGQTGSAGMSYPQQELAPSDPVSFHTLPPNSAADWGPDLWHSGERVQSRSHYINTAQNLRTL